MGTLGGSSPSAIPSPPAGAPAGAPASLTPPSTGTGAGRANRKSVMNQLQEGSPRSGVFTVFQDSFWNF